MQIKDVVLPRRYDRLYHLWQAMKQRCYSPKNQSYKYYHAKGITVCDEWVNDFATFKEWALANGYDYSLSRKEQSLDRKDNSKGYSPENCRFISHSENCKNTDRNIFLTYDGKTMCISDWSKELGIPIGTIRQRLKKTSDVTLILEQDKMSHRSNTGIKGISIVRGKYQVYVKHQYLGVRETLKEAIELREAYDGE